MEQEIEFFPLGKEFKKYNFSLFRADFVAALSVMLLALPQALAYAFLAELPPQAGIFAAIFGTIFTSAFGFSRVLVSGPTNTIAILIQSATADILQNYYPSLTGIQREAASLEIVLQIVCIVGIFQILAGTLKLGRVTQFASRAVLIGYMAGAALVIIVTQAFPFSGIEEPNTVHLYQEAAYFLGHLHLIHLPTLVVGAVSLILFLLFQRYFPYIPGPLIVFVLAGLLLYFLPSNVLLFEDIGPLTIVFPNFSFPTFDLNILKKLVPIGFAIAVLSSLEVTAIGRAMMTPVDPLYFESQEIYGLGMSNFLSSFFGGMPSSGSFSRTVLNRNEGAHTRFAAIFSGILLFPLTLFLGTVVGKIPLPTISALMFVTAFSMVNMQDLKVCLASTTSDRVVVAATFFSSFLFPLDVTLYIGIVLSIVLYLKRAATPTFVEYTFNKEGKFRQMEENEKRIDPRIAIIHAEGELFFAAAELLNSKLRQIAEEEGVKVIILEMMNARNIDASSCLVLRQLQETLKEKRCLLLLSSVTDSVERVLKNSRTIDFFGKKSIFKADEKKPSSPIREAYAYAKSLI